jgi:hypothetical protein
MESPTTVTITLQINSPEDIRILDANGKVLPEVDPNVIKSLYEKQGGVRHIGELIYDPQGQARGCCYYENIAGRWVCIVPC